MAIDIVPELLENIQRDFNTAISRNEKLQAIQTIVENRQRLTDKQMIAIEVGLCIQCI